MSNLTRRLTIGGFELVVEAKSANPMRWWISVEPAGRINQAYDVWASLYVEQEAFSRKPRVNVDIDIFASFRSELRALLDEEPDDEALDEEWAARLMNPSSGSSLAIGS